MSFDSCRETNLCELLRVVIEESMNTGTAVEDTEEAAKAYAAGLDAFEAETNRPKQSVPCPIPGVTSAVVPTHE